MEGDRPDNPWEPIVRLLGQLPAEVRQPLADWLDGLMTDHGLVVLDACSSGSTANDGTALPVAIQVEPAVLKLTGGEVTLKTGTATGIVHSTGHATGTTPPVPQPLWGRTELLIVGLVVFVVLAFHDKPFTDGLADALWELSLILIALGLGYRRQ